MTPNDSRPSGCTSHTPFEEELVNAMNDFANSADAPDFDTTGIVRKTRRRRSTAIAGIAAALIVAGGGTALATAGAGGSDDRKPAAVGAATDGDAADVVLSGSKYKTEFGGLSLDFAKQLLLKSQLELGTVGEQSCGKTGKPGTVIAVEPHSPAVVSKGDTINLTLCGG
ncbi:PASTA domain-containing protein [Streptomyces sp. NPDC088116]|uniref:PASTA domain-containing protein n=1 Tax=Streptomyces sp. NPDC088116 TaxID=3365825 RepID=UPI0037F1859A